MRALYMRLCETDIAERTNADDATKAAFWEGAPCRLWPITRWLGIFIVNCLPVSLPPQSSSRDSQPSACWTRPHPHHGSFFYFNDFNAHIGRIAYTFLIGINILPTAAAPPYHRLATGYRSLATDALTFTADFAHHNCIAGP